MSPGAKGGSIAAKNRDAADYKKAIPMRGNESNGVTAISNVVRMRQYVLHPFREPGMQILAAADPCPSDQPTVYGAAVGSMSLIRGLERRHSRRSHLLCGFMRFVYSCASFQKTMVADGRRLIMKTD